MTFDLQALIQFAGLIGGFEGIKWLYNRRTNRRKEEAIAASEEINARSQEFEHWKKQVDYLQTRLDQRDMKVDHLYKELRDKEDTILRLTAEANINDLKLTNAEEWRCNILDCTKRHPPKDYKRLNDMT